MLPTDNRLRTEIDIQTVKKNGKFYNSENFKFLVLSKNNDSPSRFAFIASKNISKKAVTRNKIRRHLRNSVRENLKVIKQGFDCVFIAKPSIKASKYIDINQEVALILKKSELLD